MYFESILNILGKFNSTYGAFWALGSQAALLLVGAVITSFVPNEKRRQEAIINASGNEENHLKLIDKS